MRAAHFYQALSEKRAALQKEKPEDSALLHIIGAMSDVMASALDAQEKEIEKLKERIDDLENDRAP